MQSVVGEGRCKNFPCNKDGWRCTTCTALLKAKYEDIFKNPEARVRTSPACTRDKVFGTPIRVMAPCKEVMVSHVLQESFAKGVMEMEHRKQQVGVKTKKESMRRHGYCQKRS